MFLMLRPGLAPGSRPSRARELKPCEAFLCTFTGASRPSRARELKQQLGLTYDAVAGSRPSRARELKPRVECRGHDQHDVAPLAGA